MKLGILAAALFGAVLTLASCGTSTGMVPQSGGTQVNLSQKNYRVLEAGAVGEDDGWSLLCVIPITSAEYAVAKANLYDGVAIEGKATGLANFTRRSKLALFPSGVREQADPERRHRGVHRTGCSAAGRTGRERIGCAAPGSAALGCAASGGAGSVGCGAGRRKPKAHHDCLCGREAGRCRRDAPQNVAGIRAGASRTHPRGGKPPVPDHRLRISEEASGTERVSDRASRHKTSDGGGSRQLYRTGQVEPASGSRELDKHGLGRAERGLLIAQGSVGA